MIEASAETIDILGVPISRVNMGQAIDKLENLLEEPGLSMIFTPNSEIIVQAKRDLQLMRILQGADLVIPDGIGIVYASRILKKPLTERVTGIDFLWNAFALLEKKKKSVFFLGGKAGVAEVAAKKVKDTYKDLEIAGCMHGYFDLTEEKDVIKKINDSKADFLCVALGAPKQEKFIKKHKDNLNVSVAIGVGGSLDVYSGRMKRAPEFFRNNGLEWLYRLIKQPKRIVRMMSLPVFMIRVIFSKIR